jgi:AraC family transcriptional regulator
MQVNIVTFPETRVASISHTGSGEQEHETVRKLVAWKLANRLTDPARHRQYGLHYFEGPQAKYRVDFCLSVDQEIAPNSYGIEPRIIPSQRCAVARDVGSRDNNRAALYLYQDWLPESGESLSSFPVIFHYVNVGPGVKAAEAITDVYLPLK